MNSPARQIFSYFDASNQRDFEAIEAMLYDEIEYNSDNAGSHRGKETVLEMMHGFFAQFSEITWTIDALLNDTEQSAEVAFTCRATRVDGSTLLRRGYESVKLCDGKISRIVVRSQS